MVEGDIIFWILIGIIALAIAVSIGASVIRGRRELPKAEQRPAIEQRTGEADLVEPPSLQPETPVPAPTPAPSVERPEAVGTRMGRLRRKLASSNNALARAFADLLAADRIDEDVWDDFETTLISSDLGVGPTTQLTTALRKNLAIDGIADPQRAKEILRDELISLVGPDMDRTLRLDHEAGEPAVVLVVGVNGTGKTTTVGKLGRMLVAEGKQVVFGAADTFRAAAADQLQTWGERVGVPTVRGDEGADPASIAYRAVEDGIARGADVVLVDTAGRLHTKTGLMDELGKVKRVIEKKAPVSEVLLVIDATTGQNGLTQARIFAEVVDVTGIVLTKLDGSAKGGIVVQVQQELGVPVKFIGLGEGADDLAPFEPASFVDGLLGD